MKPNWKIVSILIAAGTSVLGLIGTIAEEKTRRDEIREEVREALAEERENEEES